MTTIKLNNYYPHLTECVTLEVSEEIAVTLSIGGRMCDSYKRRKRDHDECSLDGTPGFEADVTYPPLTPEEIMELAEDRAALYAALDRLPPVQARRVYAHYILGRKCCLLCSVPHWCGWHFGVYCYWLRKHCQC